MTTTYIIEVLHADRDDWVAQLTADVAAELSDIGLHGSVHVSVQTTPSTAVDAPVVAVYLSSPAATMSRSLSDRIQSTLFAGIVIVPVVEALTSFSAEVHPDLAFANGFGWNGAAPGRRLARRLLEYLGLEDGERQIFISHKRDDGLGAAEQLHDHLTHLGFRAFIDRFSIRTGEDVQRAIADALEDYAFLLLLETPLAHSSKWVFDEVDYALSHTMGTMIVRWPGATVVPGSRYLPRMELTTTDLTVDSHGYSLLTTPALDWLAAEVEASHASGLVRRRRMLIRSVEEAARARGCTACVPLPGWRLHVQHPTGSTIVGITPRLPTAEDLHHLDHLRLGIGPSAKGLLVHSSRTLESERRTHLSWVRGARALDFIPENAIGGWW